MLCIDDDDLDREEARSIKKFKNLNQTINRCSDGMCGATDCQICGTETTATRNED